MARHSFGGDASSWVFVVGGGNVPTLVPSAELRFYSAITGGTAYTDLATSSDGSGATTAITAGDGTTVPVGSFLQFWGPDNVWVMWCSANGGPRFLVVANDLPVAIAANTSDIANLAGSLASHLAASNPHAVRLVDLTDVNAGGASEGQLLSWDSGTQRWVPVTVGGLSGTVLLTTAQTISGTKTFDTGNPNSSRIIVQGSNSQVSDLMSFWSGANNGQGGSPQRTTYMNEKGELRVIAARSDSVAVRFKGQPGQTADVFQHTDTSNNPISWMDAAGRWRAPNRGHTFAFSVAGDAAVGTGPHRIYNDTGVDLTIRAARASVGTAPAGSSLIVDINKGGTSIYTNQANRPTIASGSNTSGRNTSMNTTAFENGTYLTVDIDQVGSTTAGKDLVVQVLAY